MKAMSLISALFLCCVLFFSWGYASIAYGIFPYKLVSTYSKKIHDYVIGGQANQKSLREKISNDLNLIPSRKLVRYAPDPDRTYSELSIPGLSKRRLKPAIYSDKEQALPKGYLFLWGAFDFDESSFGGVLLNSEHEVLHTWIPRNDDMREMVRLYSKQQQEDVSYYPIHTQFPHGMVILRDGSLIFNDGDAGNGMQKINYCSNTEWIKLGRFNHTITKTDDEAHIWTIDGPSTHLHKIRVEDGETVRVIKLEDVFKANTNVDPVFLRRNFVAGEWLHDYLHINDVEQLSPSLSESFPGFDQDDLLVSFRSINEVLVFDSITLDIKWWRVGEWSRQHDPDWQPDGSITVYDNQMRDKKKINYSEDAIKFSRILSIDPENYGVEVVYDGKRDNFYSNIRGKHQVLPDGKVLITSSMQGRVMMVNESGETVFEFLNTYDDKNNLLVSEAVWLPHDYFDFSVRQGVCEAGGLRETQWTPGSRMSIHYVVKDSTRR